MRRFPLVWLLVCCALSVGITYFAMTGQLSAALGKAAELTADLGQANRKIEDLGQVVTQKESTLLGYRSYKTYLTAGKQAIGGQTKLLTASVTRDEGYTKYLTASWFGLQSSGAVEVTYSVEYSFGFDLQSDSYDVRDTRSGIEIQVGRPALVAMPAVTTIRHRILSDGIITDEKGAVIALIEEASKRAKRQGVLMASDPAIVALCEKRLTDFLYDFLSKEPNVTAVPRISVVYKQTRQARPLK